MWLRRCVLFSYRCFEIPLCWILFSRRRQKGVPKCQEENNTHGRVTFGCYSQKKHTHTHTCTVTYSLHKRTTHYAVFECNSWVRVCACKHNWTASYIWLLPLKLFKEIGFNCEYLMYLWYGKSIRERKPLVYTGGSKSFESEQQVICLKHGRLSWLKTFYYSAS